MPWASSSSAGRWAGRFGFDRGAQVGLGVVDDPDPQPIGEVPAFGQRPDHVARQVRDPGSLRELVQHVPWGQILGALAGQLVDPIGDVRVAGRARFSLGPKWWITRAGDTSALAAIARTVVEVNPCSTK